MKGILMAHIVWINLFAKNHFIVWYCLYENEIVCRRQKDYLLGRKKKSRPRNSNTNERDFMAYIEWVNPFVLNH